MNPSCFAISAIKPYYETHIVRLTLGLVASSLLMSHPASAARFISLGALPNGIYSRGYDLSADGTVVVGESYDGENVSAFRWTEATGMQPLGNGPSGAPAKRATAISPNGQVVAGLFDTGKPFKWTATEGLIAITPRIMHPKATSYDGAIIIGRDPYIPGGHSYWDMSWDGAVLAGNGPGEAFREIEGAIHWLGDLPGSDFNSLAYAISPDGTIILGSSATTIQFEGQSVHTPHFPFYWTAQAGMQPLGGARAGSAEDISQGHLVITGHGIALVPPTHPTDGEEAYRWTPATGMRTIRDLLLAEGIDVGPMGWTNLSGQGSKVSADGRWIMGNGTHNGKEEAWLVELDVPGDFDGNGNSDGQDFLLWQLGYGTTCDDGDLRDWTANLQFLMSLANPASRAAAEAVPEPSVGVVLLTTALGILSVGRRQKS